jgi:DNA-binding MarR family transcriptional regulator
MPSFFSGTDSAPAFQGLLQALARASQAVSIFDASVHRANESGLTPSQADVIFTLGGTEGMACADIGAATLITKGTLTGVIDRLHRKGLVERWEDAYDARRTVVALTAKGEALFDKVFPPHVAALRVRFDRISASDRDRATRLLDQISVAFTE